MTSDNSGGQRNFVCHRRGAAKLDYAIFQPQALPVAEFSGIKRRPTSQKRQMRSLGSLQQANIHE